MLDRLFENPSKKLQSFLKWLFVGATLLEIIWAIYSESKAISLALARHEAGGVILALLLMLAIPVISTFINYIMCLFGYMVLNFFTDIHSINEKLPDKDAE